MHNWFFSPEAQAGGADYLEQPSGSDFSKHWKEETVRVIAKAAHEHGDKGPETVLQSVRVSWNTAFPQCTGKLLWLGGGDAVALPQCDLGAWALISSACGFISNSLLRFYFLVRGIRRISNQRLNCPFDWNLKRSIYKVRYQFLCYSPSSSVMCQSWNN